MFGAWNLSTSEICTIYIQVGRSKCHKILLVIVFMGATAWKLLIAHRELQSRLGTLTNDARNFTVYIVNPSNHYYSNQADQGNQWDQGALKC